MIILTNGDKGLIRKVWKTGDSIVVSIPKHLADMRGLKNGDEVKWDVAGKQLVLEKVE